MKKRSSVLVLLAPLVLTMVGILAPTSIFSAPDAAAQTPQATPTPAPRTAPPLFPLDDNAFLRWPLPASAQQYGRLDGFKMKPDVTALVAMSEKSRADGNQFWGRITGTAYHRQTQEWVADRFRKAGLEQVRLQEVSMPAAWYPSSWTLSALSGGKTITLTSAQPTLRSPGTVESGLELEPVYVGQGTEAEMMGRDLRGKAVVLLTMPTPSALEHSAKWLGTLTRVQRKGAGAIVIVMGLPGNFQMQLWGNPEVEGVPPVPAFSLGLDDGNVIRGLIETGQPVKLRFNLRAETKENVKAPAVWGFLPGTTDENILVMAHSDGYFQAAVDNASGVAVMLGLAEYFAKTPKAQRRRSITFLAPIGHHVTPDVGLRAMPETMKDFWPKTALIVNCEHVATTQTYLFGPDLRKSTAASAHRFAVGRSRRVGDLLVKAASLFGVALYAEPGVRPTGDLSPFFELAPGVELIESNAFYHSNQDGAHIVPAVGLEAIARMYAKLIDDVNKVDLKDLVDLPAGTR